MELASETEVAPAEGPDRAEERGGEYIGFLPRCLALAIDSAVIALGYGCCAFLAALLFLFLGKGGGLILLATLFLGSVFALLSFPLFAFFYFWFMHGWQGQTVGKMFMGIRVVRRDGGDLSPGLSFLRLAGSALSVLSCGLGFAWALLDREKCCWHDRLAATRVVAVP